MPEDVRGLAYKPFIKDPEVKQLAEAAAANNAANQLPEDEAEAALMLKKAGDAAGDLVLATAAAGLTYNARGVCVKRDGSVFIFGENQATAPTKLHARIGKGFQLDELQSLSEELRAQLEARAK